MRQLVLCVDELTPSTSHSLQLRQAKKHILLGPCTAELSHKSHLPVWGPPQKQIVTLF